MALVSFSDLYRWDGPVDRGAYWIIGLSGFAIKHNIDRVIASTVFGRKWSLFNYLLPETSRSVLSEQGADLSFLALILALSLPFIYTGVALTIRRLRAVGWPLWLVLMFFAPFLNLIFFIVLGLVPSREDCEEVAEPEGRALDRLVPTGALGSAALGVFISVLVATGLTVVSVKFLDQYGLALFAGIPFGMGFASVLVYGYHTRRAFLPCMFVALLTVALLGGALVALAFEGVFCIAMAAPLGGGLACLGGAIGYLIQANTDRKVQTAKALLALLLGTPILMGAESADPPRPPRIAVVTAVEIDAPPEVVWRNVVAFSELPPPEHFLFRNMGIAYPLKAEIRGRGVGAVRHCVFSTGPFVEPITVWNEPELLRFTVTAQPKSMEESSPWGPIDAPHIDDYLVSEGGQFELIALPGGRTRLEGTTWYRHNIWPAHYWQVWSDLIIHGIHERVLRHIKRLSEREASFRAR